MAKLLFTKQATLDIQDYSHGTGTGADNLIDKIHINEDYEESDDEELVGLHDASRTDHPDDVLSVNVNAIASDILMVYYDTKDSLTTSDDTTMYNYIKKMLKGIDEDTFKSLSKTAKEVSMKERSFILKCKVIEGLQLNKHQGNINPYCLVGILNKDHIESKLVRNNNMLDWANHNMLHGEMQRSSVKTGTHDPAWNEAFDLPIDYHRDQYLVVEIWLASSSPVNSAYYHLIHQYRNSHVNKLSEFFFSDERKDFLGRVFYRFHHIPIEGVTLTFDLLSHSTKKKRGKLTLNLKIIGQKEHKSEIACNLEFTQIMQCVVLQDTELTSPDSDKMGHVSYWDGEISPAGELLLAQYANIHGISPLQRAAIQLHVFMEYHKAFIISMTAINKILQVIQSYETELIDPLKLNSIQVVTDARPFWADVLIDDMMKIFMCMIEIMKIHIIEFNHFQSNKYTTLLQGYLFVLYNLYHIRLFKANLSKAQLDMKDVLTNAIESGIANWMAIQSVNLLPQEEPCEKRMNSFKEFCMSCLKQYLRSYHKVNQVFKEIGIDYFAIFFVHACKLLYKKTEMQLIGIDSCLNLVYENYLIIQKIYEFGQNIDMKYLMKHAPPCYQGLFEDFVLKWIEMAGERAKDRLKTAVRLDQIVKYSDKAAFSSSAVDAHTIFTQIISFWRDLKWLDRTQSIEYLKIILKLIKDLSLFYADEIFDKEELAKNENNLLIVTDRVSVILNNIHHIRHILMDISNEFDMTEYCKWLDDDDDSSSPGMSHNARAVIASFVVSTNMIFWQKIENIVSQIMAQILIATMNEHISKVTRTDPNEKLEKILDPMIDYMSANIGKLSCSLLEPLMILMLKDFWINILTELRNEYNRIVHVPQNPYLIRIEQILTNLSVFFEADGNGLTRDNIETKEFIDLRDDINFALKPTHEVVRFLCEDLLELQIKSKNLYGKLSISCVYDKSKKSLIVNVISAENIPPLDRTGKSDPYVIVYLLPKTSFVAANEKVHKTSIKKQTLDPIFNETLELPANSHELTKDGSILVFAVFDYDFLTTDDFAGLCVVSCNSIPHMVHAASPQHLNLFQFQETRAFKELIQRDFDHDAANIIKTMKTFTIPTAVN